MLNIRNKKSCQIKSEIVSEDEKEKNIREILNLGHTFGHAIESLTGFSKKFYTVKLYF